MASLSDEETERSGRLCLTCSMCCDGTFWDATPVWEDEVEPSKLLPVDPSQSSRSGHLPQPCSEHGAAGCRIFGQPNRPRICSSFVCRLLGAMQSGQITEEEAQRVAREARALRDTFQATAPASDLAKASGDPMSGPAQLLARFRHLLTEDFEPDVPWPPPPRSQPSGS